jgi:membrane-bound lytic murein transglycosylase D
MTKRILHITLLAAAAILTPAAANADKAKNILDVKSDITDSNIVFPESYEIDTRKMLEGWYMKNYTATDDRYRTQGDVTVSDATIRERLASLNTVIDMPFNQIVRSYIDRYTAKSRPAVAAMLGLSLYYMPIFEQALEEAGLPLELKYLPVIESGLDPNAVSRHGATGLWQFMLATGKGLDMEVSSLVDERRDPYLSSQKAAGYLKDLYATYNDWSLAIAAYNCGPGTVNKAIRRAGGDPSQHDFWSIYYFLPAETRGYVPMFIAANYVMNYYPYHNISPVLATKPLVTDTLMISDRVHFNQISKILDIPVDQLRVLNPQFRADIIPGRPDRQYTLVLPSQQVQAYIMSEEEILDCDADKYARRTDAQPGEQPDAQLAQLIENEEEADNTLLEQAPAEQPATVRRATAASGETKTVSHKVEPGETLSAIAKKYQVDVNDIKSWNNLTRNAVRTGQMLRITTSAAIADASGARPVAPSARETQTPRQDNSWKKESAKKQTETAKTATGKAGSSEKSKTSARKKQAKPASHTVKSGENLTTIAKKYGTTVAELKKANKLTGDELHPGDALKIPSSGKASAGKKANKKTGSKATGKTSKKRKASARPKSGTKKKKR